MPRYVVYETVVERVTYKHVVEAASEQEARSKVADDEDLTPDQGEWVNTETESRDVGLIQEV